MPAQYMGQQRRKERAQFRLFHSPYVRKKRSLDFLRLLLLHKYKTVPFLNTATDVAPEYARIGKSTIFDLVLNAQTEENDFIENEMPTTDA